MFGRMLKRFVELNSREGRAPPLSTTKFKSYEDYIDCVSKRRELNQAILSFERGLIPDECKEFTHNAHCYVCGVKVDLLVDFNYSYKINGYLMPNWRERLVCPICHLNNRMRAVVHIFNTECRPDTRSTLYITEQTTSLYKLLKERFPCIWGSEYLGSSVNLGSNNENGIRNEDLTCLSFDDGKFDYILSFDVFEHIPDYRRSLAECCRCLKSGGVLFFTVPFAPTSKENIVRASISPDGEIVHLLPAEYHGNPLNPEGCLSFYHFGWEILGDLRSAGFKDSTALVYWSKDYGYLGGEQMIITATAP